MRNGRTHMTPPTRLAAIALASGLILGACGGGGGGSDGAGTTTISGTAASGAPMTSGTVELRCKGSLTRTATLSATGTWSAIVPAASLPCAASASGDGKDYYSFTLGNGSNIVTNVTPLTTLALAATRTMPDAGWFAGLDDSALNALSGKIAAALTELRQALQDAGYRYGEGDLPASFNPMSTAFEATTGNPYDDLLEALKTALGSDENFSTLVSDVASTEPGAELPLPEAPTEDTPTTPADPDVSGPLSAPASATYTESFINLTGDYKLAVTAASAGGENIFNIGDVVSVKIQNAGPPYSITYTEKTGGAVKTRSFDTNTNFHKEGSEEVLNIKGRFSSDGALQARYRPADGHLTLYFSGFYGSTREGLATFENRTAP